MFDSRSNLSKQVYNEVRAFAGSRVFQNIIPRRVRLAESTSHGVPGVVYDPNCFGVRSYVDVAKELLAREQGVSQAEAAPVKVIPPDPVDRLGKIDQAEI